jgi:transcriptional regulator with XRE-family HTH domain
MKLSETIKNLRQKKGWTQQTLATKARLPYNAITKIEQGYAIISQNCRITTLTKIADAFEISLDDLVK